MNIDLHFSNSTKCRISEGFILKLVNNIFAALENSKDCQIGINIVGETKIRKLNKLYRNKDKVTDILSFAEIDVKYTYKKFFDNGSSGLEDLGEMFICWQEVKRKAESFSWKQEKMFAFLVVHGVLHLLGYDHIKDVDAEKMQKMEQKIMMRIKYDF